MSDLLYLLLAWALYCTLHSLLARPATKAVVARRWPGAAPFYRLVYNLVAGITLLPVLWLMTIASGPPLLVWPPGSLPVRAALLLPCLWALVASSRSYSMCSFIGWPPRTTKPGLGEDRFVISPPHRHVRHPWYAVGLVVIWLRDLDAAGLVSNVAVTLYLILGSRLEEHQLATRFGDAYERYRHRVPGLLPIPGRSLSEAEGRALEADARLEAERPRGAPAA